MFHETVTDVGREVAPQWFLAGDKRKTAGQLLGHEVPSLSDLIFAGVRDEILHNEFPGRNTSYRNRSFYNRQDDL